MVIQTATMARAEEFRCPWPRFSGGGRRLAPPIAVVLFTLLLALAAAADSTPSRAVLEQKIRLLESYFASATVARIGASDDPQAKKLLAQAKSTFAEARDALTKGDIERSARGLDEALRKVSNAAGAVTRASPKRTAAQEKAIYERLRGQIESYRNALGRGLSTGAGDAGTIRVQARLDQILEEAAGHAQAGRYRFATESLTEAYRAAVVAIAAQRKGETAVIRLDFETPADEYLYERKRNDSYEMLIGIMMNERQAVTGGLKAMVARMIGESRDLRDRADTAAGVGDYPDAIATMEDATRRLVRALRAGGLPVPE